MVKNSYVTGFFRPTRLKGFIFVILVILAFLSPFIGKAISNRASTYILFTPLKDYVSSSTGLIEIVVYFMLILTYWYVLSCIFAGLVNKIKMSSH